VSETRPAALVDQALEAGSEAILKTALHNADDGELFLERTRSEGFMWEDGRLRSASYDSEEGFGLRVVAGEAAGYAHANELGNGSLKRAASAASIAKRGYTGTLALSPARTNKKLYSDADPLAFPSFEHKIATLAEIDAYVRAKDPRVVQVGVSMGASRQEIAIVRPDGDVRADTRPLVKVSVSVTAEKDGRRESGSAGGGSRADYGTWIEAGNLKAMADEALRIALVNLNALAAPAGEMEVVLGSGWPGILLHEAVGHGLEGDFNRKGTSAFSGRIGQRVAAKGVTILDDGTLEGRRGSLTIDDEGTPTERTVLIEDGILVGYLQDRQNARLMNVAPTGNGRRESFAHLPMPRMTNTYMDSGEFTPEEIIASIKKGVYATNFSGGSVDITSGKFNFNCSEAYYVEDGQIRYPIKGASIIGDGPSVLTKISMIGNDSKLDDGVGTCGKAGQHVPVGVGQPTLRIAGLTVGGAG
jgi:TldD protein